MDQLFLHYGPGGNAQVERHFLGPLHPSTEFWDQPIFHESEKGFEKLLKSVEEKVVQLFLQHKAPIKLWGHSFGCDLALLLLAKHPDKVSSVLLDSPVFDLPKGFLRFGYRILKNKTDSTPLRTQLTSLMASFEKRNDLEILWKIVETLVQFPEFNQMYWGNLRMREEYQRVAEQKKAFDFLMWRNVLNDFLSNENTKEVTQRVSSEKIIIRIGENDPYFDLDADLDNLRKRFPLSQITTFKNAGHFTHLEILESL